MCGCELWFYHYGNSTHVFVDKIYSNREELIIRNPLILYYRGMVTYTYIQIKYNNGPCKYIKLHRKCGNNVQMNAIIIEKKLHNLMLS